MQVYEDRQVQHASGNGLQRPSGYCYRKTSHAKMSGGVSGLERNNSCGHVKCIRQLGNEDSDIDRDKDDDCFIIDRSSFNQGVNAKFEMIIRRGGGSTHVSSNGSACSSHPCQTWEKVGALCATDYKWVQQEQVDQGKIIPVIR